MNIVHVWRRGCDKSFLYNVYIELLEIRSQHWCNTEAGMVRKLRSTDVNDVDSNPLVNLILSIKVFFLLSSSRYFSISATRCTAWSNRFWVSISFGDIASSFSRLVSCESKSRSWCSDLLGSTSLGMRRGASLSPSLVLPDHPRPSQSNMRTWTWGNCSPLHYFLLPTNFWLLSFLLSKCYCHRSLIAS